MLPLQDTIIATGGVFGQVAATRETLVSKKKEQNHETPVPNSSTKTAALATPIVFSTQGKLQRQGANLGLIRGECQQSILPRNGSE